MKTIELEIVETGRDNLKAVPQSFNRIRESFETKKQLKQYLIERYGKIPMGKKKIYVGDSTIVGFLHSFWNQDISHMSPKWYQTDWITFWEQETTRKYFSLNENPHIPDPSKVYQPNDIVTYSNDRSNKVDGTVVLYKRRPDLEKKWSKLDGEVYEVWEGILKEANLEKVLLSRNYHSFIESEFSIEPDFDDDLKE